MNEIDVGVDFGITNSDIAIKSDKSVSYKTLSSEKNIHLSLKDINGKQVNFIEIN